MNFVAFLERAAAAPAGVAPNGWAGGAVGTDIAKVVEFIQEKNKVAVNPDNTINVIATVQWAIDCAMGHSPAGTVMTANHLETAWPQICLAFSRHAILGVLHSAGCNIVFRLADAITLAEVAATANNAITGVAAMNVYNLVMAELETKARVLAMSKFALLAIVANASHRALEEGHNWYTNNTRDTKTSAGRLTAMAAGDKEGFTVFMLSHGHDIWHLLSNDCLKTLADNLTGVVARVPVAAVWYDGVQQAGAIHTWIKLSTACVDRYPPGEMGKGAVMVGLGELKAMIQSIGAKMEIDGAESVLSNMDMITDWVSGHDITRAQLIGVRKAVTDSISMAHGFTCADPTHMVRAGKHIALDKLARANVAPFEMGATLFREVSQMQVNHGALAKLITAAIEGISRSLTRSALALDRDVGELEEHKEIEIDIPEPAADLAHARMMELLRVAGGRGGLD